MSESGKSEVFLLWHTRVMPDGEEDAKLLGVFSSEAQANGWADDAKSVSGFEDSQAGFHVDVYSVNERQWTGGYVTDTWVEADPEAIKRVSERAGYSRDDVTMRSPDTGEVY